MTNDASEANQVIKKFDDEVGSLKPTSAQFNDSGQFYTYQVKTDLADAPQQGMESIKNEGKRDLKKVRDFIMENPLKGGAYALGAGALLSFLFLSYRYWSVFFLILI